MLFYTVFLVAMFTAIVLIPPLTYVYNKLDLVDMPSPRKVHTVPIPRVGGIAIVIASIIPVIGWVQLDKPLIGMLMGVGVLFILGIFDDVLNLSYKSKFIVQIFSIALIFSFGFVDIDLSYFIVNEIFASYLLLGLYFFFILGVTNAINLADGLDGLAGGVALLSLSIIGLLAYESNNLTIVLIVLAVIGSVFGFLRFNTYPAKIFMGDTGSLFLGFVLGALSVALTYGADNAYAKSLPLLLVGLPIFDTLMVMLKRIYNKQSPFVADRNHLHHKLLDHGYKHYQSVLVIYLIQSVYILTAYFMRYDTDLNILLAFVFISSIAFLLSITKSHKSIDHNQAEGVLTVVNKVKDKYINHHAEHLFLIIVFMMMIYIGASVIHIHGFDNDILILLLAITILSLYGLIFIYKKPCSWPERIAIHVMIVLSIYYGAETETSFYFNIFHIGLLVVIISIIALLFLGNTSKRFVGSPLDFLLVATAIVIPNLPNSPVSTTGLSMLIIELLILFYCVEYILFNIKNNWWAIRSTLAVCACLPIFINFL